MKFKITQDQVNMLKRCAQAEARKQGDEIAFHNLILEPGIRYNTSDDDRPHHMNIRIVSDDPQWNDTDLHDYGLWKDFRKGIELTPAGSGEVDFYIRKLRLSADDDYLFGNVQVMIENGELVAITGTSGFHWTKEDAGA